jgi:hypothetical protein
MGLSFQQEEIANKINHNYCILDGDMSYSKSRVGLGIEPSGRVLG